MKARRQNNEALPGRQERLWRLAAGAAVFLSLYLPHGLEEALNPSVHKLRRPSPRFGSDSFPLPLSTPRKLP